LLGRYNENMPSQRPFPPDIAAASERISDLLGARAYPRTTPDGDWAIEVVMPAEAFGPRQAELIDQERGHYAVYVVDPSRREIVARPARPD
jgi:hypothetical protein